MMMARIVRYWGFECDDHRWPIRAADGDWSWRMQVRLRKRLRPMKKGEWPTPSPLWTYEKEPPRFSDTPCDIHSIAIISTPLRDFLRREAPGVAEYLPVRFQGPGSERIPHRYWAVNWLRAFDCLDEEASMNDDGTGPYIEVPVIDPARIPADGVLGVLKGFEVLWLIRNDLRLKIKKAGFTGMWYSSVAQINRPESINFEKVDWSKAKNTR